MNIKKSTLTSCLLSLGLLVSATANAATFVDATQGAGLDGNFNSGHGWGDFNNDGCADLITTGIDPVKVMQNNCDGTFTDVTVASGITTDSGSWAVVWVDYNADGHLDVFIAGGANNDNKLFENNGDGTFSDVTVAVGLDGKTGIAGATFADYDNDGDLDLFVAGRFGMGDVSDALYNFNNGMFTDVADTAGVMGASDRLSFMGAFFDYDMDGDLDLYVAVDFGTDVLYQNNNDGTFTDVSVAAGIAPPGHGMGLAVGDLNNDGCLDIASSNNGRTALDDDEFADHGPSIVYLNNCDGTFSVSTYAVGVKDRGIVEWGLNYVDYDNDGDLDFSVVGGGMLNAEGAINAFYENDGSGNLIEITQSAGLTDIGASFGSTWVDYDNDGDLDWFVGNHTAGESKLYRNDSTTGHYLTVRLECLDDNIDCVGATVKATAGSRTQMRLLQAGVSYANSEIIQAHFGLGIKDVVDTVMVTWPNGEMVELSGVAVDQVLTIVQEDSDPVTTGDIVGTLRDPEGALVSGARVLLREMGQSQMFANVFSDADGKFSFSDVPAGDWEVLAIVQGSLISRNNQFTLDAGETEVLDLTMVVIPAR